MNWLAKTAITDRTGLARRARTVFLAAALLAVLLPASAVDARRNTPNVPASGVWVAGHDLPGPMVRGVGVYFPGNGRFYVMGGRASDSAGSDYTQPFEYNPGTDTWATKSATYPDNQVNNMACAVLSASGVNYIYCVGGSAAGATTATGRVFRYQPVTNTLQSVAAPWPGAGTSVLPGGFAVYNNKLYILGGFNINVGMTNQIWEFTPGTASWSQKGSVLPSARGYIPTATIGTHMYTGGGSDYSGGLVLDENESYVFDPVGDAIGTIATIPRITGETRAVNQGGQMWVLGGGRSAPNPSNEVDVYDPASNTWSLGPAFTTARRNFAADNDGGRIWLAGGYDSSGLPTSSMEILAAAPGITSVSPVAGPPGGGQSVIIKGFNFSGVNWVSFGSTAAASFTVNSSTKITAVTPAHAAGTIHVRVNTGAGTSPATDADRYTFETAPTISSISPRAGPLGGGQTVIINGTNLMGTNWVSFGGVAAPSFTVNSPIKITAVTPAHAAGVVHVRVNTPLGTSAITNADKYAFEGTPTITSVSPDGGPPGGGQSVVIHGANLFGANWVSFGGVASPSFTVDSPSQITAVTPAHAAGTVHVRANTPLGTSAITNADLYFYGLPPTISSVSPQIGPAAGGQSVIITGTNFSAVHWVSFGSTAAASFTVDSPTQITAVSPAHAAGTVHIRVNTGLGTSAATSADLYGFFAHYTITTQTGQSIVPGVTDIGNHGDDTVTAIALPFPVYIYGVPYTSANVSSNGNIQFGTADTTFTNVCLPWAAHGHAFFASWDDLYLVNPGYGIFTTVTGSAPNRTFYIEWRAQYFPGSGSANFEFAANENNQVLRTIYGVVTNGNTSSTMGVQDATNGIFDQFACNGAGGTISSGTQVTYTP